MKNLYGLILAGGSGTRLWPISREYYPKQFLQLFGEKTLIQQTFIRLKRIIPPKRIYITTNRIFIEEIVSQLEKLGLRKKNIIIQPADKNTGPTIAHAAKKIYEKDKSAIIVNCPSDHLIKPMSVFISSLKAGYKLAQKNYLVTFGVKPKKSNPEYGYISREKSNSIKINSYTSFKVKGFVEKPKTQKAATLIKKGSLWNSGIFIWKAEVILSEMKILSPAIYKALESNKNYVALNPVSIDISILEKSNLVWVIPVNLEWADIGSWKALFELLPKDSHQNVTNSRVVVSNSSNSLIYGSEGRVVTAINLKDIIVVDTQDSVLVSHKENVHEIKNVLGEAKKNNLIENSTRPLVTIIIPVYNDYNFIEDTLRSVLGQNYKNIELIIIDGGSTDKTLNILDKYSYRAEHFLSMPNTGRFEKMNKGIKLANGEIIGILDPGNSYINKDVIDDVVHDMNIRNVGICWGDLIYVDKNNVEKILMYWKSSEYKKGSLKTGWIPAHPTFFVRKNIYNKYGVFNTKFRIAAEYDLMLRFLGKHKIRGGYLPKTLVKMKAKGINIKNILDRFDGNLESYMSWKENGLKPNPLILISKNLAKLSQLWTKKNLQLNSQNFSI